VQLGRQRIVREEVVELLRLHHDGYFRCVWTRHGERDWHVMNLDDVMGMIRILLAASAEFVTLPRHDVAKFRG
jgi:lipoprotein signal peptidase